MLGTAVSITKTTPQQNVIRGQLVPYEITLNNSLAGDITDLFVVDDFPAGFSYVEGSARIDGVPTPPVQGAGRSLTWNLPLLPALEQRSIVLLLAVGAGVTEGEFTNRGPGETARRHGTGGGALGRGPGHRPRRT